MSGVEKNNVVFMRLLVFCVIFYEFQYGIRVALTGVLNENLLRYFSVSASEFGTLVSIFFLTYTLMQIPSGLASDNFSLKKITIAAFCFTATGFILFISTQNFYIAFCAQILVGIGCSFAFVLIFKITSAYFSRERGEILSSIALSCGNLGPVIISPIIAYITSCYPWKTVIITASIFGLFCAAVGHIAIDEKKLLRKNENIEIKKSVKDSLEIICTNKQVFLIGLFSMLILGPVTAFCDVWGLSFLRSAYNLDKLEASSAISLIYTGMIFGCPFFAYTASKIKSYKIPMIAGGILLFLFLMTVIFFKINFSILSVVLFLIGLLTTCQFLVYPAAINLFSSEVSATVTGVVNTMTMSGCTFMVKIIGVLMDFSFGKKSDIEHMTYSFHDYQYAMISIVAAVLLAIFSALFIKDSYKNE